MPSDILFYIQIGLGIASVVFSAVMLYLLTKSGEPIKSLTQAENKEGPEKERLILKSIAAAEKQLAKLKEGRDDYARAQHKYTMGIAYEMLADFNSETANINRAIGLVKESISLTDREKYRVDYVKRRTNLAETYKYLSGLSEKEKNLGLAIGEYKEALAAADIKEMADRRLKLMREIAVCHMLLAQSEKDMYNVSESIRYTDMMLKEIDRTKAPVEFLTTSLMRANAFTFAATLQNKIDNLHEAQAGCDQALGARNEVARELATLTSGAQGNVAMVKMMDVTFLRMEFIQFHLLTSHSLVHMQLADAEDRQRHLDAAAWDINEAMKLKRLQEKPEFLTSLKKWKEQVRRMQAGETFEAISGKDGETGISIAGLEDDFAA